VSARPGWHRSQIAELSVRVRQQVPEDDRNGVADGDDGFLLAAAAAVRWRRLPGRCRCRRRR
jgi:hypothetical protein